MSAGALIIASAAIPAKAQQTNADPAAPSGPQVEEITVTAQRRSENLQNVPIAISTLTATKLEQTAISRTDVLFQEVPALTVINSSGFLEPRIRGIGNSSAGPTVENSVSTYVDGVYIASAPGSLLSLNNVDRVEILKGPQGTLFGRNATGGLIQVITKDPKFDFGGNANFSYGNYNAARGDLYLTGPVSKEVAADLAVSIGHQGDGYGTNIFNGHDIYRTPLDIAARAKMLVNIGERTKLRASFDFEDIRSSDPAYAAVPGTIGSFYPTPFTYKPRDANVNNDPFHVIKAGGVSLRVDHDFDFATFTSITAYRRTSFDQAFDADLGPSPLIYETYNQSDKQFTQEVQLTSSHKSRLQWVVGVYYFNLKGSYDPLQLVFGPLGTQSFSASYPYLKTESIAGYGQATYEILPRTNITAGLRYTDERRDIHGQLIATTVAGAQTATPYANASVTTDTPTARLSIDHKFSSDVLGYLSYNRGFKSGGFNPQSPNAPAYSPEYLDAYEAGVKSLLLDHRLRLNVAAYLYEYQNIQVNTFIGSLGVIYNGASARLYGLDTDLDFQVTNNLSFSGGVSLIHDRFTSFPLAVVAVTLPTGRTTTAPGSATGNRLPFTPDFVINAGINYKHDFAGGIAELSLTQEYSTGYFIQPDNFLHQRSYDIVNGSLTYRPSRKPYYVSLFANNILNETIIAFGNVSSTGQNLSYQAPRTFGGKIGIKF